MLLSLIVVLVVVGVVLYLLNTYVPMAAPIRTIINVLVVLCVIVWLLEATGLGGFRFGHPPSLR